MNAVLIFLALLLSACTTRSEHSKALEQFTVQYEKILSDHLPVKRIGYGGALMHDIAEVSLSYAVIVDRYDIISARIHAVGCISLFTQMINVDEKVQPYLHEKPFPAKQFDLYLSLRNLDGTQFKGDGVMSVVFARGKLHYHKYNPVTKYSTVLHTETYEEARDIVERQILAFRNQKVIIPYKLKDI